MATEVGGGPVGLVLAGGGARGAYEVGVLSKLLPALGKDGRPTVLVGNSIGALNVAYLAATAQLDVKDAIDGGVTRWQQLVIGNVIGHLISVGSVGRLAGYLGELVGIPRARLWSLLNSAPRAATIGTAVDFKQLERNRTDHLIRAVGVVATSALTRRSVVFHDGGGDPPFDVRRRIQYVATPLSAEHVVASSAIPGVFPAAWVSTPEIARGWYVDGGTRLNTPIKPAIELGAERVIVIGLAGLAEDPSPIAGPVRPDALAGIDQLVYALLADRVTEDVRTLAQRNVAAAPADRVIPYIFIAPAKPGAVEELAHRVFRKRYRWPWQALIRPDLALIGRATGTGVAVENATLFSMLAFDPMFIEGMIKMGREDAERWLAGTHDAGLWQTGPL
ncbi:MAG TPA: patatin-like phospholipase family protein [Solirubrobacteraceae bacterium]|jgi:NTE family protein|nr:patatin-like phospholipase family protein [Solirubrobacteraceae bacterium]